MIELHEESPTQSRWAVVVCCGDSIVASAPREEAPAG
jgi:hypothetical protein